jgi:pimeloyl-ACP methyl ester carboxylesterase
MRKLKKFLIGLLLLLLVLAAAGYTYDRIATARDRKKYPYQGQLVDIGGYRIHLYCTGSGNRTVLLDAGGFDSLEQWKLVQPEVAKFARVCSFDRAGFGWSDPSPYPQTGKQIVHEFHAALARAGVSPPFIYVGHSISGLDARLFAAEFPGEVVGMVLDDSVHPREYDEFPENYPHHPVIFGALRMGAPLGVPRLLGMCKQTAAKPDCGQFVNNVLKEINVVKTTYAQAANAGPFGNLPLVVLAHDPAVGLEKKKKDPKLEAAWSRWQENLAGLSTNSRLIVVKGCGHEIQTEKPEVVVEAIRSVVVVPFREAITLH